MSFKTYIARDQESVYDIALKLYRDTRGVSDIIMLNPGIDIEAETIFGQEIAYDDAVVYKKEVFVIDVPEPEREPWKVREFQNVYDLAIQVYGDIQNLDKILSLVDTLDDPAVGTLLQTEFTDNILANNLFSRKIVATSNQYPESEDIASVTFDSTLITFDSTIITWDHT